MKDRLGSDRLLSLEFSYNLTNYAILLGDCRVPELDQHSFMSKLV